MITSVKNFPHSRGMVLELLKGFVGLSGAIFTQIYHESYGNNSISLIMLIGWFPCAISFLSMFMVRLINSDAEKNEEILFRTYLYIALTLVVFLLVVINVENHSKFPSIGFKIVSLL